jgi:hypothetical protein
MPALHMFYEEVSKTDNEAWSGGKEQWFHYPLVLALDAL